MTKVKFFADKNRLLGFEISGHSSKNCDDTNGKIVCSAVSSAAYMAANTIEEILGSKTKSDITDGFMSFTVIEPDDKTEAVLRGLELHLNELSRQYSNRIKITTEV